MLEYPHGVFQRGGLSATNRFGPRCGERFQKELQFSVIYGVAGLVDWGGFADWSARLRGPCGGGGGGHLGVLLCCRGGLLCRLAGSLVAVGKVDIEELWLKDISILVEAKGGKERCYNNDENVRVQKNGTGGGVQ